MKINGKQAGVHIKEVVFPRDDEDVVVTLKAIPDESIFDKMCPAPQPRAKRLPNGQIIPNYEDKNYQVDLAAWAAKKTAWYVVKTITEGTEGLEWELVDPGDHTTWNKYQDELRAFGLSAGEISHLINKVLEVNALTEASLEQARKRFLARRQEELLAESFCLKDEPTNTQSTEPAKGGA